MSRSSVSRVYARELVVLPQQTEQNVPIKVIHASSHTPSSDWLLEPRALAKGVHIACVLLPDADVPAAFRVANLLPHPYTLAAGADMRQASMAQVLDTRACCRYAAQVSLYLSTKHIA